MDAGERSEIRFQQPEVPFRRLIGIDGTPALNVAEVREYADMGADIDNDVFGLELLLSDLILVEEPTGARICRASKLFPTLKERNSRVLRAAASSPGMSRHITCRSRASSRTRMRPLCARIWQKAQTATEMTARATTEHRIAVMLKACVYPAAAPDRFLIWSHGTTLQRFAQAS